METAHDSTTQTKPGKPYPQFPLYTHACGQWAKKIRDRTVFFGPWANYHKALAKYLAEKDDLEAGRPARAYSTPDGLTVHQMVSLFLAAKILRVRSGEMEARTWENISWYGERMIRVFGKSRTVESLGPADFTRLRTDFQRTHKSPTSIKGDIRKSMVFFNWSGPGPRGRGFLFVPFVLGMRLPRRRKLSSTGRGRRRAFTYSRQSSLGLSWTPRGLG